MNLTFYCRICGYKSKSLFAMGKHDATHHQRKAADLPLEIPPPKAEQGTLPKMLLMETDGMIYEE